MMSTKECKELGHIKFTPESDALYVSSVKSYYPENKKYRVGSSLIHFAQKMSEKMGFGGKLRVFAYNSDYRGKSPSQFFRKLGFSSHDKDIDDMLDFTIEYDIDVPPRFKQGVEMFYHPNK